MMFTRFQHQGTLKRSDPKYNGSLYNVQVELENGEITYVPLSLMIKYDKVTMAQYAVDNNLTDTEVKAGEDSES